MVIFLAQQAAASEDIEGIINMKPEPSLWPIILIGIGVFLVLLLIGWLIWYFLLSRLKSNTAISPTGKALRRIQSLESTAHTLNANEFSLQLSETLKDFLQEKFGDRIRFETADEFLTRFAAEETNLLPPPVHQDLRSFVVMSEELKFGSAPDRDEKVRHLLPLAHNIVNLSQTTSNHLR